MLGQQNPRRRNTPLALRLKIDDLHAHLAPLDRYGPTGVGSAIAEVVGGFFGVWRNALRSVLCRAGPGGPDCKLV